MQQEFKRKRRKCDTAIILTMIGLFLVPIFVREMFLSSFYQLNIFAFLGCMVIIGEKINGYKLRIKGCILFFIAFILVVLLFFSEIHAGRTLKGIVRVFCGLIVPLSLMYYRPKNPEKTIKTVTLVFNIVTVVVVSFGLLDLLLLNRTIIAMYYSLAGDLNYYNMARSSVRLFSYLGHPLYNAEIFLIALGLNYAYNDFFIHEHKNDGWILVITITGVAMTASKSAIIIFLGMLCVLYIKNLRYMFFSLIAIMGGYVLGGFDLVIERFAGSLTTGRYEVWNRIKGTGVEFFHFFWGNGSDSKYSYAYLEEWARAAFEYPYRLFALEFGVLFCVLIMFITFGYPLYELICKKKKSYILILIYVAVSLHVNMYNGIGTYSDHMYLFSLFTCMILNMNELYRNGEFDQ